MESPITTRAALIWALGEIGASHGGALALHVKEATKAAIVVGDGSLYPTLANLVTLELVREKRTDGTRRRVYELTATGKNEARVIAKVLRRLALEIPSACTCGAYGSRDCAVLAALAAKKSVAAFGCPCPCHRRFGLHAPPPAVPATAKPPAAPAKPARAKTAAKRAEPVAPPPRPEKPAPAPPRRVVLDPDQAGPVDELAAGVGAEVVELDPAEVSTSTTGPTEQGRYLELDPDPRRGV